MLRTVRPALTLLLAFTLITGLAYPLATTGLARLLFPAAGGSLVLRNGKPVGSLLIGQDFTAAKYFHPRPSATTPPYNAAASAGSNLGPTAAALADRVQRDAARLHAENQAAPIPADLLTTSASGLDPHISPEAAQFQIPRIARARGIPPEQLRALVAAHTEGRLLGILGEARVNVLAINLALDKGE
jgi:K+-transporting ATPase ATPase C chain